MHRVLAVALLHTAACTSTDGSSTSVVDVASQPAPSAPVAAPSKPTIASPPSGPLVGALGTAHPTILQAIPEHGHWIALCQAREDTDENGKIEVEIGHHGDPHGDAMRPYLVRAAGAGEEIGAFVDRDDIGRHLAVLDTQGTVRLIDSWRNTEVALPGADASDDPNPAGPHRAVAFDAGRHAAWSERHDDGRERIVVRDLEDGSEQRIDPGPGLLWRFDLDSSGRWLWIWSVDDDTDKDGELEPPEARSSLGERFCRGPAMSWGHYGWDGDRATPRVVALADGVVLRNLDALGTVGGELIVRNADKALVRRGTDGERVLVPASCAGQIVHADEEQRALWVACTASGKRDGDLFTIAPLHRYGFDDHTDTGLTIQIGPQDEWRADDPILYTSQDKYVNVATRTVGKAIGGPRYGFWKDRILYAPSEGAFVYELDRGVKRALGIRTGGVSSAQSGSRVALVAEDERRSVVLDLEDLRTVGHVDGQPIAMAPTGEVLVAAAGDWSGPLQGPLQWLTPK